MARAEAGRHSPGEGRHAGGGRTPEGQGRGPGEDARRGAGRAGGGGRGGRRLNATWGRASEVLALRVHGLQVEIADRQHDARPQPGPPHQAPRRAHRRLGGPGGHEQGELQRQQGGPREAAHGRRARRSSSAAAGWGQALGGGPVRGHQPPRRPAPAISRPQRHAPCRGSAKGAYGLGNPAQSRARGPAW